MTSKLDYIAGAVISNILSGPMDFQVQSIESIRSILSSKYAVNLQGKRLKFLIERLEKLGIISIHRDSYAGIIFIPNANTKNGISGRYTKIIDSPHTSILKNSVTIGDSLIKKVFENDQFWLDLDLEIDEIIENNYSTDLNYSYGVPASDRIVNISDNQKDDLEKSANELIEIVEKQNGVDGDLSVKQQLVGQLKAGRELVRAGVFRLALMEQTILSVLGGLIEKYKNQAIGHAAKKLLDLLIEHVIGK